MPSLNPNNMPTLDNDVALVGNGANSHQKTTGHRRRHLRTPIC